MRLERARYPHPVSNIFRQRERRVGVLFGLLWIAQGEDCGECGPKSSPHQGHWMISRPCQVDGLLAFVHGFLPAETEPICVGRICQGADL